MTRHNDSWSIDFDGKQYGPYKSEREAALFAIDAAHTLGEKGGGTQVLVVDEDGEPHPLWTFGVDPYPPRE